MIKPKILKENKLRKIKINMKETYTIAKRNIKRKENKGNNAPNLQTYNLCD
jgi:hypothetical protein